MAMTEGMGVTPVYNLDRIDNDGFFGDGGGMWMMMFLFFLLAWGGNGFGGFGGGNAPLNTLNNDFLYDYHCLYFLLLFPCKTDMSFL